MIWATDNDDHGEEMYSVRLRQPLVVEGVLREDAEHLPARIAHEIFTQQEINSLLTNNNK
ncbi:hypothetical protein JCM19237_2126 [Photobacterium aphoticum]|uniref:Uncharacterized protein n=1 Tax=Photobacterium aphoticum TaxID=754436 RepID=A0A090QLI2_9GAMM|nr:hypothetical protein JCM19237_2126 [Photobacterium aphoticum]